MIQNQPNEEEKKLEKDIIRSEGEGFGVISQGYAVARRQKRSNWSSRVTKFSNALDLEPGVFTWKDPRRIARSLKSSAEESHRRKAGSYQSAMSMLNFYINRAGAHLNPTQKKILEKAKEELRELFKR